MKKASFTASVEFPVMAATESPLAENFATCQIMFVFHSYTCITYNIKQLYLILHYCCQWCHYKNNARLLWLNETIKQHLLVVCVHATNVTHFIQTHTIINRTTCSFFFPSPQVPPPFPYLAATALAVCPSTVLYYITYLSSLLLSIPWL